MDVGDANDFQKGGEKRLMFADEVDRVLVQAAVASCFQWGDCV